MFLSLPTPLTLFSLSSPLAFPPSYSPLPLPFPLSHSSPSPCLTLSPLSLSCALSSTPHTLSGEEIKQTTQKADEARRNGNCKKQTLSLLCVNLAMPALPCPILPYPALPCPDLRSTLYLGLLADDNLFLSPQSFCTFRLVTNNLICIQCDHACVCVPKSLSPACLVSSLPSPLFYWKAELDRAVDIIVLWGLPILVENRVMRTS
jgi:hypothetical protein